MTLDQIRYFLAAASFEHVGRAARAVYISPSAVSSAIAALERELDLRLFDRKSKRIFLTPAGQEMKRWAERMMEDVNTLGKKLKRSLSDLKGTYRFAASHFLASRVLAKAWFSLQEKNQELVGEFRAVDSSVVFSEILLGRVDLGVCFNPLSHPELEETILYKGSLLLAARKGHPIFRKPAAQRLQALKAYPSIMHKASQGVDVSQRHSLFERLHLQPTPVASFDDDEIAFEKLKSSDCWTVLPDVIVKSRPDIQAIAIPERWESSCDIKAVRNRNRPLDPALQKLIVELRRHPLLRRP